ncbi:MAG: hypothetical protein KGN16_17720 [Burkholderiales bacterium]|nr:hypothetical protein [Burkholderiales bacterium]
MSTEFHVYRTRSAIRRRGCLVRQTAVEIPGMAADASLHDWAEQLMAVDQAIDDESGVSVAEITAADLNDLDRRIGSTVAAGGVAGRGATDPQLRRRFVEAARSAISEGDQVYVVKVD